MDAETVKWLSIDRDYSYFMRELFVSTSSCPPLLNDRVDLISVAIATWVVYDHITTFGDEVELVWARRKLSVVQILFFLNRYTGAVMQMNATLANFSASSYPAFVLVRHILDGTEKSLMNFTYFIHVLESAE
ncbi:hypothetical protein D9613_002496 [Agrocybe pediades]|uniref:DUF6533 domain-containing protein n=1 Tax=Agrocybe pediades TaxID=84607 RepID=A0A8H4QP91_9AGAR|nr:hypothetical protein D9613_002496 [Agrocybe pediades]